MSSETEKLDKIRKQLVKQPLERRWRVKKSEETAYARYHVLECLYQAKEPLTRSQLAFKLGKGYATTNQNIRVLLENNVLCNKLDCLDGKEYFSICPVCPIENNCETKLAFWIKSGLMNREPLPSQKFLGGEKEASGNG